MQSFGWFRRTPPLTVALLLSVGTTASPVAAQPGGSTGGDVGVSAPSTDASIENLFKDFLHYARMGRFTLADAYAKQLLTHPELDPVKVLRVAHADRESLDALQRIIRISSIGESAAQVLSLIHEGENAQRKSPERILANIELLGGTPQQEFYALRHLAESGEYAVPLMIETLLDSSRSLLWPRVINALPKMGKPAVNPLVIGLNVKNNDVRLNLIHALGEIGYPQAIPYLRRLIADEAMPDQTKTAAKRAIERIETIVGRPFPGSAEEVFYELAQWYYNEDDAVRADPRLDEANVWYWNDDRQMLDRAAVPQRIFGQVMAMRCCEEAMKLQNDHVPAVALWLASNIRREHRLGLNVESGDPDEMGEADATRPAVFPRALYFTQSAGPRYAHLVLDRAIRHHDSAVALGAIEALRVTAGESSLIGTEDYKQPLVRALQSPDLLVRIRASLALGASLPRSPFDGSQWVMPVLSSALAQTGREQVVVVDADEMNRNRVMGLLRGGDRDVIGDGNVAAAFDRARAEFSTITALFISPDMTQPGLAAALRELRAQFAYTKLPVVVLTKSGQSKLAMDLAGEDPYVEAVPAAAADQDVSAAFERVRARTGQAPFDADLAMSAALQSAETLRRIAADGRTIFDVGQAEPALIEALASSDERLQTLAASVLAMQPSPPAQRAVGHVAFDDAQTTSLRLAAFDALAVSARIHGNMLEEAQVRALLEIAHQEADLTMRTAASQALGAINLDANGAGKIIRSFHGG